MTVKGYDKIIIIYIMFYSKSCTIVPLSQGGHSEPRGAWADPVSDTVDSCHIMKLYVQSNMLVHYNSALVHYYNAACVQEHIITSQRLARQTADQKYQDTTPNSTRVTREPHRNYISFM